MSKLPKVVHYRKSAHDVYIGRPSKWGNPFEITDTRSRGQAIQEYEAWIRTQPDLLEQLVELDGKILGCWCAPNRCHGDILVKLRREQLSKSPLVFETRPVI